MVKENKTKKKYDFIPSPLQLIITNLFLSPIYLSFFLDNVFVKIIAITLMFILSVIYSFVSNVLSNKKIREELLGESE